ncbi:class I SAM-dependent methyltransferase [Micromonospora halophytica]|uniref:Methyltransferase domain-containing protein n=1 Tax=Micromonospora halophytica TaxID=47864 RepID=A0A1C5HWS2_9ACTN|nr:class I SAM-dependent methyltransferase [Micromonospora halophytica]SCG50343.1 Methyltransferase domain-containing protein [Micromonospora halophytica]
MTERSFAELVAEATGAPVTGWGFSWLDGRATEERPPWGYARLMATRMAQVSAALDVDTGGGEVLAGVPTPPPLLVATEGWPPNAALARRTLRRLGATVVRVGRAPVLPFRDGTFELVTSRHPIDTWWDEIARVLRPGGTYLSQQIGPGTMRELSEAILGPLPPATGRHPAHAVAAAEAAGLTVVRLEEATLRAVFHDVGAVVWFLRKVVWTVPDFDVERYRPQLATLHERIRAEGPFVAHARRFLIEARNPAP